MPTSACLRTTSLTPWRTCSWKAASSYGRRLTLVRIDSRISGGRTRLPTCVVRMRSELRFIRYLSEQEYRGYSDECDARSSVP